MHTADVLRFPRFKEVLIAILLSLGLLVADLLTFSHYPTPWCDEVSFSESAINLATRGTFNTFAWPTQPSGSFWAVNTPLYPLLLSGWIKLFGQDLLSVRSLNYLLITIACLCVWLAAWRFRITGIWWARVLVIPLVHLAYGMSFAYRCSRPDILSLILVLLLVFSLGCPHPVRRGVLAALCAALAIWSSPSLIVCIGGGCLLAWVFRLIGFRDLVWTAFGGGIGVASVIALYYFHGVLPNFMAAVAIGRTGGTGVILSPATKLWRSLAAWIFDYSLVPLLAASGYFLVLRGRALDLPSRRAAGFLFALVALMPGLVNATGTFNFYYSYMIYVPASVLALFCHSQSGTAQPPHRVLTNNLVLCIAAAIAMAVGLPLRLLIAATQFDLLPRSQITQKLREQIHPGDSVYSENTVFFEVKSIAPEVFGEFYHRLGGFTAQERERVNVLVIFPKDAATATSYFGGRWVAVGGTFGDTRREGSLAGMPRILMQLNRYLSNPQAFRAPVQIYRRI